MSVSKTTSRPVPERRIVDASGISWHLTEVRVWDANGRGANSLIAAHEHGFRRLWNFPADWTDLSDDQLAELVSKPVRKARAMAPD